MNPRVTVIGCDRRPLSPEAAHALASAGLVIGAPRHLDTVTIPAHAERIELRHLDAALDAIIAHQGPTAVLASGDPGFFGIVRALRARGLEPHVVPAVSSVAARLRAPRPGLGRRPGRLGPRPRSGQSPGRRAGAPQGGHPDRARYRARDWRASLLAAGKRVYVAELPRHPGERVTAVTGETSLADPNILISLDQDTSRANHAGWPATRAPRTAGRCPRTRSPTATR